MAVGPCGTSLQDPKNMYTKDPKKAPYRPNWKRRCIKSMGHIKESNELTAGGSPAMPE